VQTPLQAAVREPPATTLVALALRLVPVQLTTTVKLLLTARRVPLPANKRSSYVPAASVVGITRGTLPLAVPVVVRDTKADVLEEPGTKSPIQSLPAGAQMPLHAAVTDPPVVMLVGLALTLVPVQPAVTVKLLLTARRV
jgi:hypothetical protein